MNTIILNAQKEFDVFKRVEIQQSKESLFHHAHKIAGYEYLLFIIESNDWEVFKSRHPNKYTSLVSNDSLLYSLYDTLVTEELELFNSDLFDNLMSYY